MKKSSSSSNSQSQIIVLRKAPNWPAMVASGSRERVVSSGKSTDPKPPSFVASSSLWLRSRQLKSQMETSSSAPQLLTKENFASKSYLVRQCQKCQVLYTHCHQCVDLEEKGFLKTNNWLDSGNLDSNEKLAISLVRRDWKSFAFCGPFQESEEIGDSNEQILWELHLPEDWSLHELLEPGASLLRRKNSQSRW